jgi:glutathione peroxidase
MIKGLAARLTVMMVATGVVAAIAIMGGHAMASQAGANKGGTGGSASEPGPQSAHDFSFTAIEGGALPMDQYRGKAVLVVNTASRCGFTNQYEGLQELWSRYRSKGLVVLGVPSNDFGRQEPGTETEIKEFCSVNFAVDFPMTEKVVVSGKQAHPLYRWMAEQSDGAEPQWNFYKYLIDPDGRVVKLFPSQTRPTADVLVATIEQVLPK